MNDGVLAIAITDMRSSCRNEPDLTERLRKAMKAAQTFWMSTDDDLRFRGAVGAALSESSPDEQERIKRSLQTVRSLSALISGVPVDIDAMVAEIGDDTIPLLKLWHEAKDAANA